MVDMHPSRTWASVFLCLTSFDIVPDDDGTDNDEERKDGEGSFSVGT